MQMNLRLFDSHNLVVVGVSMHKHGEHLADADAHIPMADFGSRALIKQDNLVEGRARLAASKIGQQSIHRGQRTELIVGANLLKTGCQTLSLGISNTTQVLQMPHSDLATCAL